MKMQSRAASGLSTDSPGVGRHQPLEDVSASIAEEASVIAAGSVDPRRGRCVITVNGPRCRAVRRRGARVPWPPVRLQTGQQQRPPGRAGQRPGALRSEVIGAAPGSSATPAASSSVREATTRRRGAAGIVDEVRDRRRRGARGVAGAGAGDGVLETTQRRASTPSALAGLLVGLGVRLALGDLVAGHRDGEGAGRQLGQGGVEQHPVGGRDERAGHAGPAQRRQQLEGAGPPGHRVARRGADDAAQQLVDHPGGVEVAPVDRVEDVDAESSSELPTSCVGLLLGPGAAEGGDQLVLRLDPQRLGVGEGAVEVPEDGGRGGGGRGAHRPPSSQPRHRERESPGREPAGPGGPQGRRRPPLRQPASEGPGVRAREVEISRLLEQAAERSGGPTTRRWPAASTGCSGTAA